MTYSDRSRQRLWIISPEMNYLHCSSGGFHFLFRKKLAKYRVGSQTTSVILSTRGCISQRTLGQTPLLGRHPPAQCMLGYTSPCQVHAGIHPGRYTSYWNSFLFSMIVLVLWFSRRISLFVFIFLDQERLRVLFTIHSKCPIPNLKCSSHRHFLVS